MISKFNNNSKVVTKQLTFLGKMGNSQNKVQSARQVKNSHEKFKMLEFLDDSEEMILSIPYEQKSDILEWEKLLKDVKDCDPEFLLMPKKYMIAQEGLCGTSGVIKVVYDNFTYEFEEQIKNHAEKYKYFEEAEVWYLLFAILSSVKQLDRLSMKVGDIRPYNIFVNQNGQVKLSGVYSWPRQVQNTLKTSYDKVITYLAPQQLHQCRVGQKSKRSHIVGQSFSVGLTLLHTCLLKPMDGLYNLKKYEFNSQKLFKSIEQLTKLNFWNEEKQKNQKYSPQLIYVITGLLQLDQSKRLSTIDLYNELQPHAEEILNLREFQIPNFKQNTPTKTNPQQNRPNRITSQYSSIKKKQYNEPQSLGFQVAYGFGAQNKDPLNYNRIQPNISSLNTVSMTPQKRQKSKQKLQISLNTENGNVNNGPRHSISREKYHSNPDPRFSFTGSSGQYKANYVEQGRVPYAGEFKVNDLGYKTYQPIISQPVINPKPERIFQFPSNLGYAPSTYVNYQPKYQIPSHPLPQYRPPQVFFNQPPTISTVPTSQTNGFQFSKNVDLTTSEYTVIQKTKNTFTTGAEFRQRTPFAVSVQNQGTIPTINPNYQVSSFSSTYQTSTVKPVVIGQTGFGTFVNGNINAAYQAKPVQQNDFLKKIDEQLNKSRQMYPTGNQ